jgi:hypothetical protein
MKKIEFIASSKEIEEKISIPEPSAFSVPEWYKKSFKFKDSNDPSFDNQNYATTTIKSCMPVFDAITLGYVQKTWCDVFIEIDEKEEILFRWSHDLQIIYPREKYNKQLMPTPIGHYNTMLTWARPWGIKTPKNYSVILMHPSYRDLPFTCFPGIIDTDKYNGDGIRSVPFYIKKGFSGLIPKGTPMYQIIPIKRDNWVSVKRNFGYKNILNDQKNMINTKFYDKYKKMFWQRKKYQ